MGIKAIDDINRTLKDGIFYLRTGKVDSSTIKIKNKNTDAILYTLQKCSNDLNFLSNTLAQRGYGDKSLLGRLKQAFQGLFGGF
jgi:hypothetical protein